MSTGKHAREREREQSSSSERGSAATLSGGYASPSVSIRLHRLLLQMIDHRVLNEKRTQPQHVPKPDGQNTTTTTSTSTGTAAGTHTGRRPPPTHVRKEELSLCDSTSPTDLKSAPRTAWGHSDRKVVYNNTYTCIYHHERAERADEGGDLCVTGADLYLCSSWHARPARHARHSLAPHERSLRSRQNKYIGISFQFTGLPFVTR